MKGRLPTKSRVRDLDGRQGTVTRISKDGGKRRWVDWDDGESYPCPVEELTELNPTQPNEER